jgi:hypothetical protein
MVWMAGRWRRLLVVLVVCGSAMVVPVVLRPMAPVVWVARRVRSVMVAPGVRACSVVMVALVVPVVGGWVSVVMAALVVAVSMAVWVAMVVAVARVSASCMALVVTVVSVAMVRWVRSVLRVLPVWMAVLAAMVVPVAMVVPGVRVRG